MPDYDPLFYWIRERELIRKRKAAGLRQPWTHDTILSTYRFCNVRREDDLVTIWIRDHIRQSFDHHVFQWLMICIARQINWPDTLSHLIVREAWPLHENINPCPRMVGALTEWQRAGNKVYTGAYMISAPSVKGTNKNSYIAGTVIGGLWNRRVEFSSWQNATLKKTHAKIMRTRGWGQFMAYQAVVDMRFTRLLDNAPDRFTWAAAGPGTIRGLNRLYGRPLKFNLSQDQALVEMQEIYKIVERETEVQLDFSDVPSALCETDKYLRVKLGEGRPRALYVPGRGS